MRTLLKLRRIRAALPEGREAGSVGVWVLALLTLESAGSASPSDAIDGILIAGLVALGFATGRVHARRELRWVAWCRATLRRGVARARAFSVPVGIDFRRTPRLRRGTPLPLIVLPTIGAALLVAAAGLAPLLPDGLRALAATAYVPYLALLGGLWCLFGLGTLMGVGLSIAWIHDRIAVDRTGLELRRRVLFGALGACLVLLLLAVTLPAAWAVRGSAGLIVATTLIVALSPVRYDLMWIDRRGARRALPWRRYVTRQAICLGALVLVPALIGLGDEVRGGGADGSTLGVTRTLARAFAWATMAVLAALLSQLVLFVHLSLRFARARRARPTLRLEGAPGDADRDAVRALGWREPGRRPRPGTLRLRIEPGAEVEDPLFGPMRPTVAPPGWLALPEARTRLARHRLQDLRRRVLRGVRHALKQAGSRTYAHGEGFWIAPHLWFVRGLTRDKGEENLADGEPVFEDRLGPPWERMMTWEARAYLHDLLRDLEVDLVFVEDGVGHRRFLRVIRALFEHHDRHGAERLEERHLSLVPEVRVVIQEEGGLDAPFERSGLPEPDYEDVGRARLLLVFRDRRKDGDPVDAPLDRSDLPEPVLLG